MTDVSAVSFADLGIHPALLAHLTATGFTTPTPIQAQAIPVACSGSDVLGIAQTGTGKTLAFTLPMIERLAKTKKRGLVLLPTRELAMQVEETVRKIASRFGARTVLLMGGVGIGPQIKSLKTQPHIIVATPGRLIDHLSQGTVDLRMIDVLVLDEADRMLDMGFLPQIERILEAVPRERQTMLFSATMPEAIARITTTYMAKPVRIEVAPPGLTVDRIAQELIVVRKDEKPEMLERVIREHEGSVIVFTRTKHGASKLARLLTKQGIPSAEMHSDCSQSQRQRALAGLRDGSQRVLVATDIAARGIDISHISLVINFDLPEQADDYVHRIGRTGRAGRDGLAISFVEPDQVRLMQAIERLIRRTIPEREGTPRLERHTSGGGSSRGGRGGSRGRRGGSSWGNRGNSGNASRREHAPRREHRGAAESRGQAASSGQGKRVFRSYGG